MTLRKVVVASLAGVSLLGGLVVVNTPVSAKAKTFKYYDSTSVHHKKYQSMNKYTLNKKFAVRYSGEVKLNHLYVFHVSPMRSKYQTWVKVTGTLNNQSTGNLALGASKKGDYGNYDYVRNSELSLQTSIPLQKTWSSTGSPVGVPYVNGIDSHTKQKFELLLHTPKATGKLGAATLKLRTGYSSDGSVKVTNTTKTFHLNLN